MAELRMMFENADVAEWALVRLRERGLHPTRYSVRVLSEQQPAERQGVLLNTAAVLVGMGSVQGTDYNPSGSAWVAFGGAIDNNSTTEGGQRREAVLRLEAPDSDIRKISGILLSNGGRRV